MFQYSQPCTYNISVDLVSTVFSSAVQRAVMTDDALPGAVKVKGHHIDEVQVPGPCGGEITLNELRRREMTGEETNVQWSRYYIAIFATS